MTTLPKFRFLVGAVFGVSIFLALRPLIAGAQTDTFIYPAKGQNQAQQDKDRYECHSWAVQQTGFDPSKPQSANSQSASQRSSSPPPVLQGAARGAALGAVGGAITVTPARVPLPGPQWEELLAGSAVGTKECEKLIEERMQRRRPVLGDRHTCAQCQPVCRAVAIPLIDA